MPISDESRLQIATLYSALESQLKDKPRYLTGDEGARAGADLGRFGSDFSDKLQAGTSKRTQEVLLTLPPRVEIVRGGKRAYDKNTAPLQGGRRIETVGKRLLEASTRVRNNVHHGGKDDPKLERYAGHDQEVVDAAIEVLEIAIKLAREY